MSDLYATPRDESNPDLSRDVVADLPPPPPLPVRQGTTDEAGLLQAIADDPDADWPRLVYADWFEETGDADRARLIRSQVGGPAPEGRSRQERKLLAATLKRCLGRLEDLVTSAHFDRGLLCVTVAMRTFLTKAFQSEAPALLEAARVSGLTLEGRTARWERVASSPVFSAVRALTLTRDSLTPANFEGLLASPYLAHLHALRLAACEHSNEVLRVLPRAETLPRLRLFGLHQCHRLSLDGVASLLSWPQTSWLKSLLLPNSWLPAAVAAQLAESPRLAGLSRLEFSFNYLRDAGVVALASSPTFANLTRLGLRTTHCGIAAALALASSPHLGRLNELDLSNNIIGDEGARALAESDRLAACRRLVLQGCGLSLECKRELATRFGDRVHTE